MLGYEGVEVINPEGGQDDAAAEAQRGRWKEEVLILFNYFLVYLETMWSLLCHSLFGHLEC